MRIVCSKCSAAYSIEDRLIGPAGVRAQCPRCKNQELVKRGEGATKVSTAPAAAPKPGPGVPPPVPRTAGAAPKDPAALPRCSGCGKPLEDPFDQALGACDTCRNGPAPGKAAPPPRSGRGSFEGLLQEAEGLVLDTTAPPAAATPKRPPPPAPAPAPAPAAPDPFELLGGPSAPSAPADDLLDFTGPAAADADPFALPPGVPSAPHDAPGDPFDFGEPAASPAPPSQAAAPPPAAPLGRLTPGRGVSSAMRGPGPVAPPPVNALEGRYAPLKLVESKSGPWKLVAAAVGGLIVAAAAAFFLIPGLRHREPTEAPLPAAVQQVLPRWSLLFVELSRTPAESLAAGREKLAADEPLAYGEAEEAFQQALLRDPTSDEAIIGYVQALALGRKREVDDETFAEALALIRAAEERSGRTPEALAAHAHLLLCREDATGNREQARALAQEALNKATDAQRPNALLALGRAYLETSAALAVQHFTDALEAPNPPLSAYYYRALAHEAQGEYRQAIEDLRKRLDLTPGQADALEALARVYQECGVADEARTAYARARQRYPEDLRFAVLHLAFAYQVDGDARLAAAGLRTLLRDGDKYDRRVAALGFIHLATVERVLGNINASDTAARRALKYRSDATGASLQLFLNALDRRDATAAKEHLQALSGRTGMPAMESVLQARLSMLEGDPLAAAEACRRGFEQDPRRLDALICAGVSLVRAGRVDEGYRLLHQAALADPLRTAPDPVVTRLFIRDGEILGSFTGILSSVDATDSDVRASLHEGAIHYRLGKLSEADALLRRALELDEGNALAHAYRALIALARRDVGSARRSIDAAQRNGKLVGVVQFVRGEVLAAERQNDLAERALGDAIDLAPGLLAAEVALARLEGARGQKDGARDRLRRVIARDPSYLPAKRALYTLQKGK